MAQVPTGTTFFIASAYAAAVVISSISNASEAVVTTSVAHGYANNDVVEISYGWGRLNLRTFRIKGVTSTTFILEGQDTTNTTFYPAITAAGSVRKINTFTPITSPMNPQSTGGDPKTVTYKFTDSDVAYTINDGFDATSYSLELDADAIGSAGYSALKTLTEVQTNTCFLMVTRNGAKIYQPCTVALNEAVQLQDGQINRVKVAFNGNNRLTRYAT